MSNLGEYLFEKGRAEGYAEGYAEYFAEGYAEGFAEGYAESCIAMIRNLMKSMKLDAKQAMDKLLIPLSVQEKYRKLIQ